eukprot:Sdes_comp20820_c0_seq1m17277
MPIQVDEDEHSIEMQLPYISHIMQSNQDFTLVPILVGALSESKEKLYGDILSRYLFTAGNVFVISSDFCHWGSRFQYTYYDKKCGRIFESIQFLDRLGMDVIENLDAQGFLDYMEKYENTICGHHPICIFLHAVNHHKQSIKASCPPT